jgi:putative oxidoreductase
MDRSQTSVAPAAGRLLISIIFIIVGFGKLMAPAGTIGYIASAGVPAPTIAFVLALIVELGGGILLLFGLLTRWVAIMLAIFCVFTALVFHGFADMQGQINSLKNFAMTGGLLYVAAFGAGTWSLDALLQRRRGLARSAA